MQVMSSSGAVRVHSLSYEARDALTWDVDLGFFFGGIHLELHPYVDMLTSPSQPVPLPTCAPPRAPPSPCLADPVPLPWKPSPSSALTSPALTSPALISPALISPQKCELGSRRGAPVRIPPSAE